MDNDLFLWSDRNNNKHPLTNLQSNNCDFKNPEKFSDVATITQMDLLPIKSVSYGPITYEFQAANATVGPLICYPLDSQWNVFDQVIENEENIEDIHQVFIEMKEGFEKKIGENEVKIGENEEKFDANQEKIDVVQNGCLQYNILNEKERNHMFKTQSGQYWCDGVDPIRKVANGLVPVGTEWWLQQEQKYQKLLKVPTNAEHVQGSHPVNNLEVVTRKVCFSYQSGSSSPCTWTSEIKVKNCITYFLYYLVDTPICNIGYCAQ